MRIGIVGANGRVGTDVCAYLRGHSGVEVVPIVRNILGAAYLEHQGLRCRIADVGSMMEAERALVDLDCVVVASHVFTPGPRAMAVNRRLVSNAVRAANPAATVVYFSSVRALAWRVDPSTRRFGIPKNYDRSKRRLERLLRREGRRTSKKTIALRLGHVFGPNQTLEKLFLDTLKRFSRVKLPVEPSAASNVVDAATIADCIVACATGNVPAGVYSLVNVPQWTWQQVFDYCNAGRTTLVFEPNGQADFKASHGLLGSLFAHMLKHREWLGKGRQYLPIGLEERFQRRLRIQRMRSDIEGIQDCDVNTFARHEFDYTPMPGPFVEGLQETQTLLRRMAGPSHECVQTGSLQDFRH